MDYEVFQNDSFYLLKRARKEMAVYANFVINLYDFCSPTFFQISYFL